MTIPAHSHREVRFHSLAPGLGGPAYLMSPLILDPRSAAALRMTTDNGCVPSRGDPLWRTTPWSLLDSERIRVSLRGLDAAPAQDRGTYRAALLMALASEALNRSGDRGLWVVWEWARSLGLSFVQRDTIGLLARAAWASRFPGALRWHRRLAASLEDPDMAVLEIIDAAAPAAAARMRGIRGLAHGTAGSRTAAWAAIESSEATETPRPGQASGVLWLPVGIPASGKSSWVASRGFVHVVCMDAIRRELAGDMADQSRNDDVFGIAMGRLQQGLSRGLEIVFDATNVDPAARHGPLEVAAKEGARVHAVFFDTAFRTCVLRNAARSRRVPVDAMLRFATRLVSPMRHEYDMRLVVAE